MIAIAPTERRLRHTLITALAYGVTGMLAQWLSIPPGNVMPVWPSAGIALAAVVLGGYRLWPGVWLGSFLFNAYFFMVVVQPPLDLWALGLAAAIATGASLQALLALRLIRGAGPLRDRTAGTDVILKLLVLVGPVACLVGATLGVLVLVSAGLVPPQAAGRTWLTWWLGDAIGAILVVPLLWAWCSPRTPSWRRSLLEVAVPLCVLAIATGVLFDQVRARQQQENLGQFERTSRQIHRALSSVVLDGIDQVGSVARLFDASSFVDRDEFRRFAGAAVAATSPMFALEWIPRVLEGERVAFEARDRPNRLASGRIVERDGDGDLVPAMSRAEYFPVEYVEPLAGNEMAVGFDLGSESERARTLLEARNRGLPRLSGRVRLVQEDAALAGVLVLAPVYRGGAIPHDQAKRHAALEGFAVGVFPWMRW